MLSRLTKSNLDQMGKLELECPIGDLPKVPGYPTDSEVQQHRSSYYYQSPPPELSTPSTGNQPLRTSDPTTPYHFPPRSTGEDTTPEETPKAPAYLDHPILSLNDSRVTLVDSAAIRDLHQPDDVLLVRTPKGDYYFVKIADLSKKKREQVKQACVSCAKVSKKCSETRPCQRCVQSGHPETCHDVERKRRSVQPRKSKKTAPPLPTLTPVGPSASTSSISSQASTSNSISSFAPVPHTTPSSTYSIPPRSRPVPIRPSVSDPSIFSTPSFFPPPSSKILKRKREQEDGDYHTAKRLVRLPSIKELDLRLEQSTRSDRVGYHLGI